MPSSLNYGWNGATWDRLRNQSNTADAVATSADGLLKSAAFPYGFNGATFDRLRSGGNNADGVATSTLGVLSAAAYLFGLNNGGTWQRVKTNSSNVDNLGVQADGLLSTGAFNFLYGGDTVTQWQRLRAANAVQLGSTPQVGMAAIAKPGEWSVFNTGAAGVAATILKAAPGVGQRLVITSISAAISYTGAPVAVTSVLLQIGGANIWSRLLGTGGTVGANHVLFGVEQQCNIIGGDNQGATLFFNAAATAVSLSSVAMTGYVVGA